MKRIALGFQHVLAMFGATVTVPLVVGYAIGLSMSEIAFLLQAVLLAMGVATLLQTFAGSRFPIVQGSSFAFIPGLIAVGSGMGLAAVEGALIIGGVIEAATGALGLIGKLKKLFSPIVTGVTIMLIGFSLADVAVQYSFNYFADPAGSSIVTSILVAALTFITTILVSLQGKGTLKAMPVIIGAVVGYVISMFLGLVDFSMMNQLSWFALPKLMPWGMPVFDVNAIVILLFAFMVSIIESVGDYHAISTIADLKIDDNKINRGIASEGFSCTLAGLFGACGTTSYSENIGLVALTKVSSVQVVQIGAVILVLLSMIPKFSGLLASIPAPVLGGLTTALYGMISITGLKLIKDKVELNDRNTLILASALVLGLGAPQLPAEFLSLFPKIISSILESGMAVGAITAILMDQLLKK
ncbi:NCS2 family nucleobase:cation symporter-2 [Methanococcus maripaludis]|uniref:NCS2 family nucleobase:cation symporter-2 n=1 Tax=Methanococcus maripaludis TaxID=39152 RepID=A0A7J9PD47_METMI|nr:uracil-xanthine permease family protein [Methanococcus maripaludis]MBA2841207.1 NCS2 family nucleobase:cation symporter-2 [Methanococcus maripaludis]MBA2860597.1 NCS2 family nucleobase:cation symporter-2 [Methanococcus maripaludis]MBB6402166.1 NCS2 family nucleobase:cation symporter-2 [Methanococcus maripaludis]